MWFPTTGEFANGAVAVYTEILRETSHFFKFFCREIMNDEQVRHDSDSEEELGSDASWESFGQGPDSDNSWRSRSNSRSRSRSRSGSTSGSRRSNLSSEEEVHVDAGGDKPRRRRGRGLGRDQNPQGPYLSLCVYPCFSRLDYIILKNSMGLQGGSTHNKLGKFTKTKSQPKPVEFYLLVCEFF